MNEPTMKEDVRSHNGLIVGDDFGVFDSDTSRVIPNGGDGAGGHDPNIEPTLYEAASSNELSVTQIAGFADEYTDGQDVIDTTTDPLSAIRYAVQEIPDERVGDFLHALHRVLYAAYADAMRPDDAVEMSVTKNPSGIPDEANGPVSDESEIPDDAATITGPRGGTYWIGGDVIPDDADLPEGVTGPGEDDGDAPGVEDAEPNELAGGVAAAMNDDRDDFHFIRNQITGAGSREEAQQIIDENLTADEIDALAEEVEIQQEMRANFDVVDDPANLRFGQELLYDADRPKRGVVDDIDADGTVWINQPNRDNRRTGVNPEYGTIYADPDFEGTGGDEDEPFVADEGRYGLASNPEVLENAFEAADEVKGSREAGIQGGNTTGSEMKVLEMDDGSRVFATPIDAYPGNTGVVDSPREARNNNINSPKIIEALGGTAAKTRVIEGPGGDEYIAKEGLPGDTVAEIANRRNPPPDEVFESMKTTQAAAYFVGNVDLHGGNMATDNDGNVGIIDHDSAGKTYDRDRGVMAVQRPGRFMRGPMGLRVDPDDTRTEIYEMAQDIRSGEADLSGAVTDYAEDAADKAVRMAYVDEDYDLPEDQTPADLQFPPSGIESIDDFDDPAEDGEYFVLYVDESGDKISGTVKENNGDELTIRNDNIMGTSTVSDPNRVVELL